MHGPPLRGIENSGTRPDNWNLSSPYGQRGSQPFVLNMPGDDDSVPGDYVMIRFVTDYQSKVLRTRNILGIAAHTDWDSNPSLVQQQGPDLPDPTLCILQASGGHTATVFYVGGNRNNELYSWSAGMAAWKRLVPGTGPLVAMRFFVNPYNPSLIYVVDAQSVQRSDDGGETWQVDANLQMQLTCNGRIPVSRAQISNLPGAAAVEAILTDMQFIPYNAGVRFAVGEGGAFYTEDGINWTRVLDTGALPGRPVNCYFDWNSNPNPALYVAFDGRGLVRIDPFPDYAPVIPDVVVPDLSGFLFPKAVSTLQALGLLASIQPGSASGPEADLWVFSQTPNAPAAVQPGTVVSLLLHSGPVS